MQEGIFDSKQTELYLSLFDFLVSNIQHQQPDKVTHAWLHFRLVVSILHVIGI